MLSPNIFWPCFTGVAVVLIGLIAVRGRFRAAHGFEKITALGGVLFAAPLALFGAEHLASSQFIQQVVPAWIPFHLFWTYLVGVALIAAGISIVLMKQVRLTATLLGGMFLIFVLTIHIPRVMANLGDRISWAVVLRDLSFSGAAWALAGTPAKDQKGYPGSMLVLIGRLFVTIPVIFFGVEHLLHPGFVPGVPLGKLTPAWIPVRDLWGYLTGVFELVAGTFMLLNKRSRLAATVLGAFITLVVIFLYLPIFAAAAPNELTEAMNYVADTLLFGGAILVLAAALPPDPYFAG